MTETNPAADPAAQAPKDPAADPAANAASAPPKAKTAKVRMLVDVGDLKSGRLAVLEAGLAKQYVREGLADDDKAAIAYAEKLEAAAKTGDAPLE